MMKTVNSDSVPGKKRNMKRIARFRFPVIIEKDRNGYFATCPSLQGCYTQGNSYEEALKNIEEAVHLHVEDRLEAGEAIPSSEGI